MRRSLVPVLLGMAWIAALAVAQTPSSGKESTPGTRPSTREEPAATTSPAPAAESAPVPHTEMTGSSPKSADPLLDLPPLPEEGVTLVGASVRKVDRIRNRILVQPYGDDKSMWMRFDERTHIYRDGRETTILTVKPGDRIYADTQTVDSFVFARNVRVRSSSAPAQAIGQIVSVNEKRDTVSMKDSMTGQTVSFSVTPHTAVKATNGSSNYMQPGTVVSVSFAPAGDGTGEASEVEILAVPGMKFTFAGRITYIDLSSGAIAVDNASDGKNYNLQLGGMRGQNRDALHVGSAISATTTFDGRQYVIQDFSITAQAPVASEQ